MNAKQSKQSKQSKNQSTNPNTTAAAAFAGFKWYQDFVRHVELRDIAPSTRKAYLAWPRKLQTKIGRRDITKLRESEVLDYLIALRHEHGFKDSTINQASCALRDFYRDHLGRKWKSWDKIKIRREEQLPNVMSRDEVGRLLSSCHSGRFRAMFTLMYHCGLRIGETIPLKPAHIDSSRRVLRVVESKSLKDRDIPLSDELIVRLRDFWKAHRNPKWMFPSPGRGWKSAGARMADAMRRSEKPISHSSVEAAMRATVLSLGWDKRHGRRPVTCHTLRHCFATHLLDAGVSIRLVSQYLGHSSLQHTLKYLHLTEVSESTAREVIAKFPGL